MTAIPTSTALIERLRAMFAAGIEVAKDYGDNAHHLEGAQLERQFQIRLTRMICAEPAATESQEATAERPAAHDPETCGCGSDAAWCPYNPDATEVRPASPRSAAQEAPLAHTPNCASWRGVSAHPESESMPCDCSPSAPTVDVAALRALGAQWRKESEHRVEAGNDSTDKLTKRWKHASAVSLAKCADDLYRLLSEPPPLTAKERRWCSTCGTETCWCIEL